MVCRRSAVSRQTCHLIGELAPAMRGSFEPMALILFPELLKTLIITVQVCGSALTPVMNQHYTTQRPQIYYFHFEAAILVPSHGKNYVCSQAQRPLWLLARCLLRHAASMMQHTCEARPLLSASYDTRTPAPVTQKCCRWPCSGLKVCTKHIAMIQSCK